MPIRNRLLFSPTVAIALLTVVLLPVASVRAADESSSGISLAERLQPFLTAASGEQERFAFFGTAKVPIDRKSQQISLRLARLGNESFELELTHADYALQVRRRPDVTEFGLPKHGVVFVGRGPIDSADRLAPREIVSRLITPRSAIAQYAPVLFQPDAAATAGLLQNLFGVTFDAGTARGAAGGDVTFEFPQLGRMQVSADNVDLDLKVTETPHESAPLTETDDVRVVEIDRTELERQLVRGVRRALEILAPSRLLTDPPQVARTVPHGELRWIDGQRVVLLSGSPEEVGRAHGELLRQEAQACIDSVLHTFGTAQTIRTGRWFRHDLEDAYTRLSPHIPERHKVETRAMAAALDLDEGLVQTLNVFPELFHCSGFALCGKATRDGKLYHGRVLDYMTAIGLQDAATTFIVNVDGRIPFANVGYAGFIGSVSGMNAQSISLGEMGGRGEGQWDGVPMATLMRQALEECRTLDDVMDLWKNSPRTCEYYYVFADGKTNRAVGVAALPESIEFILPGQAHERLGEGIEDGVVLSAGSRLQKLRERVQEKYGQFDAELGQWLMSRPVAMQSNLHNVLFVPEDGVLYVANADHKHPAAERPYVKLDLHDLLRSMSTEPAPVGTDGSN
ncbi:peptidase C45 acyl-coenzyme A:6-aminopenicillanic acid acyl-transferase [bacterium]|nr:peptidase C45 acyl-coenzyme A:6-aminopenicillanic acid acyl-transferase [bacterium]